LTGAALVLLCQKRGAQEPAAPQVGQTGSVAASWRAARIRWVANDAGLCLSGRTGGAPRAEPFG